MDFIISFVNVFPARKPGTQESKSNPVCSFLNILPPLRHHITGMDSDMVSVFGLTAPAYCTHRDFPEKNPASREFLRRKHFPLL